MRDPTCLLLAPPEVGAVFPRGLAELASFLRHRGHSVYAVPLSHHLRSTDDAATTDRVLGSLFDDLRPRVVGVSNLFTMHYPACERILAGCKRLRPDIVTVIGGPHATFLDREAAVSPWIDFVVRGEGELTLAALLDSLAGKAALDRVEGITYSVDDRIIRTPDRDPLDLAHVPPIDFSLFPDDYMRSCDVYGFLHRGCAFRCSFCAEHRFWRKRRDYAVDRVVDEIVTLSERHGNAMVGIEDSMVHLGAHGFHEFCELLRRRRAPIAPDFFVLSRVDTLNARGLEAMTSAGIRAVRLGVESGSPTVRRHMAKNFTNDDIVAACRTLDHWNVEKLAFWIVGHPGDNPKESEASLTFLDHLMEERLIDHAVLSLFVPYPGTAHFDNPKSFGIEIIDHDWSHWRRWAPSPVCELNEFRSDEIQASYQDGVDILLAHGQHRREIPHEGEFSGYLVTQARSRSRHSRS